MYAADQALDASAVVVSALHNGRLIHEELKRIASGVPGVRAIIVIGSDGMLRHDSYRYPPDRIDLSDREYIQKASQAAGMVVGEAVTGRSSGVGFVPLTKKIGGLTFVAVASPYALVDMQPECADCWSLTLTMNGQEVAVFPPERRVEPQLRSLIASATNNGSRIVRYHQSIVAVSWIRNERFGLISASVRGVTDSAAADVDLN
ncbi:PDC sensor domain-containing protein [Roseibium litorale]|uniref:Histidine kinase n=1 Tax=Roseibium litorale TaxID=2803841 RepID=A0ABR9CHF7_9HYPH|nr:histidine kinase [Roseibium litorale]MBD8890188.1 histidine kinase [Roseibium litorale]